MSNPSPAVAHQGQHEARPGFSSPVVAREPAQAQKRKAASRDSSTDSSGGDSEGGTRKSRPGDRQGPQGSLTIQGCGYLVAVKEDGGVVPGVIRLVGLSSNITDPPWWSCVDVCTSSSAADLLDKDLNDVFRPAFTDTVRSLVERHKQSPGDSLSGPQKQTNGELTSPDDRESDQVLTCSLVPGGTGVYLFEIEPVRGGRHQLGAGLLHVAHMMRSVPAGSTPELCTTLLCDALMEVMPAYDRVMVHRFAADSSGEVIHESTRPGFAAGSSYLGLRLPAAEDESPAAASREPLLLKRGGGVRFIADTSAQAVPVVTSNYCCEQQDAQQLDISMAALWAPPERHCRYLRSMGVMANMVVSIAVQDELWGLFTFHSYSRAVVPTMSERVMVEVAATLSAKAITRYELERTVRLSRVLESVNSYTRVQDFLRAEHRILLGILALDSIVMWQPHASVVVFGDGGVTLSPAECESLASAGDDHNKHISLRSTEARGIAYFSVRSFLLAFLRNRISRRGVVSRAGGGANHPPLGGGRGEPAEEEPVAEGPAASGWEPWSHRTVTLLGIVRHGLSSQLYAEALSADNMEVLAHVSHELRTPFHGVMSSLQALLEERFSLGPEEKDSILRSAMDAGDSMLTTLDRILDTAKARNSTELAVGRFMASRPILQTVSAMNQFAIRNSLQLTTSIGTRSSSSSSSSPLSPSSTGGNVEPPDPAEVTGDERRIKDIVQNLVSNAIKFTPSGGRVHVSLLGFGSLGAVSEWWQKESGRFDEARWNGPNGADTTAGAKNSTGERSSDGGSCATAGAGAVDGGRGPFESPAAPRWYVYCVEDNGQGILPADFGQLVGRYRQSTATSKYSGTGLGLHASSLHVSCMSGSLGIASSYAGAGVGATAAATGAETPPAGRGGGTLFAVALPLCPAAPLPSAERTVAAGPAEKRPAVAVAGGAEYKMAAPSSLWDSSSNRKLTFVVVDDHKLNVKLLQRKIQLTFEDSDVQVLIAMDGVVALDTVAEVRGSRPEEEDGGDSPRVLLAGIFLDFHMPNMSGVECTKRIRQAEVANGWPRVFISGCTADLTESSRDSFIDAGGDSVLIKPWGPGQVERMCHQMLAHALEQAGQEGEGGAQKAAVEGA